MHHAAGNSLLVVLQDTNPASRTAWGLALLAVITTQKIMGFSMDGDEEPDRSTTPWGGCALKSMTTPKKLMEAIKVKQNKHLPAQLVASTTREPRRQTNEHRGPYSGFTQTADQSRQPSRRTSPRQSESGYTTQRVQNDWGVTKKSRPEGYDPAAPPSRHSVVDFPVLDGRNNPPPAAQPQQYQQNPFASPSHQNPTSQSSRYSQAVQTPQGHSSSQNLQPIVQSWADSLNDSLRDELASNCSNATMHSALVVSPGAAMALLDGVDADEEDDGGDPLGGPNGDEGDEMTMDLVI